MPIRDNRNIRHAIRKLKKDVLERKRSGVRKAEFKAVGFASTKKHISAVHRIYSQEIIDIEHFVKFAESYKRQKYDAGQRPGR